MKAKHTAVKVLWDDIVADLMEQKKDDEAVVEAVGASIEKNSTTAVTRKGSRRFAFTWKEKEKGAA